jgi:hypothetical protein
MTRRSMSLALAAVAAALMFPAGALAGWEEQDPAGGNHPAGYGNAPDQPTGSSSSGSSSSCKWTVKGRLYVKDPTLDGIGDGDPLPGVEIRVSGASSWGSWADAFGTWSTVHTNSNGEFTVTHTECDPRRVLVEARFESAGGDLRVLGPASPGWYELKDTGELEDARTVDLAGEPFGGETGDQAAGQARTDAQTWLLYRRAIDYVGSLGHPFLNDVTVNNPASVTANDDSSWTDPVLHGIHIAPNNQNSRWNMLHELGHAWAYPRESGEDCLIPGALGPNGTHDLRETPCVAFNEGFADYFASKLDEAMVMAGLVVPMHSSWSVPYSRALMVSEDLDDLDDANHNELGYDQAFRVLTQPDVTRELFGNGMGSNTWAGAYTGASCIGRGVPSGLDDLSDALKVFGDANDQFAAGDAPSVQKLFDRADDRLSAFDASDADAFVKIVDPKSNDEPHSLYGC